MDTARHSSPARITGILSLAFLLAIIDRMIFSLLITPIKADFHISDTQAGALAGLAFGLFYTLLGLPLGVLADRVHRPRLIAAGLLLWTAATLACGFTRTFTQLFIARVCVGVGEAAISPAAYSLLTDYVPRARLARALSIYMMGTVLGVATAWIFGGRLIFWLEHGLALPPAMKAWSVVFIAAGAPGLVIAPLVLSIREIRVATDAVTRQRSTLAQAWRQLAKGWRAYGAHFIGVAALNTYAFALLTWTPAMFTREFGWPIERVGVVLGAAVGAAGIVGMYGIGALADRLVRRGAPSASFQLMFWTSVAMVPFACGELMTRTPAARIGLFVVPAMTLFFMLVAGAPTALQVITPAPLRGTISAIYLFVVNVTAYSLGPMTIGFLADRYRSASMGLAVAVEIAGLVCSPVAVIAFGLGMREFRRLAQSEAEQCARTPREPRF